MEGQSYSGLAAGSTAYGYDGLGRLSVAKSNLSGTAQDVQFTYGRNPAGQIAAVTRNNDAYAWGGHYAVNRAYTTNGLNQYSAAGSAGFSYDANGNLVSDGSTAFVYDIENRLVSASGGHAATLVYDPLGRLWQITSGSNTTRFLYDGDALVAEYDGSNNLTHRYVHGPGVDNPEVVYDYVGGALSATRFLISDERGSIVALADASGASVNTYD
jgi:hypothetical protein